MSGIYRSLSSDWLRSLRSAGHRSWQIRQPAAQSKLRELRQRDRSACFVPVIRKTQNNRNFTLSPFYQPKMSIISKNPPRSVSEWVGSGDSRSRTDDPLLAKQMLYPTELYPRLRMQRCNIFLKYQKKCDALQPVLEKILQSVEETLVFLAWIGLEAFLVLQ